jgi:hypothetical protein
MKKNLKRIVFAGIGGFVFLGLFNAFIINNHSDFSDVTIVNELHEMDQVAKPGRVLATNSAWKKVEVIDVQNTVAMNTPPEQGQAPSAISEDLRLELVEVINVKLWSHGLPATEFSGDLETSNGTIESLSINLPGKEEISVSFAEMSGNVFQYDYAGEIYSGVLYQVDPKSFMITLTNGPLEGTRLRFVDEFSSEQVEISQTLKEDHNIQVGFFGENPKAEIEADNKPVDSSVVEAEVMNMDAQV